MTKKRMNYRALLKKYVAHIIDCEGVAFIPDHYDEPRVHFEDAEIKALLRLACEIDQKGDK